MKRSLPFVIVAAVAIIALSAGALLYRAKRPAALAISEKDALGKTGESIHMRGREDAPVTVEEFADFQCPPCGTMAGPLQQVERDYGSRLRVIFRQHPLAVHAHAREAALAAEAAGLQGRFWEMHDLLFREQALWSGAPDAHALFLSYAGTIGLNVEQFKKDMADTKTQAHIAADEERATNLKVVSTPTLFINNEALPPTSLNLASLRAGIDAALQKKR